MFSKWRNQKSVEKNDSSTTNSDDEEKAALKPAKWSLGVLNDTETDEVPGMFMLDSSWKPSFYTYNL
jgi:hypothetical protein